MYLLQDYYYERAQSVLHSIREDFIAKKKTKKEKKIKGGKKGGKEKQKKKRKGENLVFVGIHNRRTDHLQYQKVRNIKHYFLVQRYFNTAHVESSHSPLNNLLFKGRGKINLFFS